MNDPKDIIRVEISYKTIIFTVSILVGLWFLIQLKEIIFLLFLSTILLSALLRPVEWLSSKGIPRILSVVLVYLAVIAAIALTIGMLVPPLISETQEFTKKLPQIVSKIDDYLLFHNISSDQIARVLEGRIDQITSNVFAITSTIFSSIFLLLTLFVFTFYLLLEWNSFTKLLASPFSGKEEKKIINIIDKLEKGLGHWIRGQLTLSIIIGVASFFGLKALNVPYALPLALIAGIMEIIPIVGPILSALPAILIAITVTPILGLAVAALFFVIQQIENHLFVPMIMSRVIGVQPPVVILALLIGAKLAGVGGAFMAVPVIVIGKILFKEIIFTEQKIEKELQEE